MILVAEGFMFADSYTMKYLANCSVIKIVFSLIPFYIKKSKSMVVLKDK